MCGIVGYIGSETAAPIIVDGLRRLEYRGYDSAGVAIHDGEKIECVRAMGKLRALDEALAAKPLAGSVGIGHTRWATHGRPSEENAHPHVAGGVAVVHNGIIENHTLLRRELQEKGVTFSSDTDTEIVAHLIEHALKDGAETLVAATRTALQRVEGAYAIAVLWDEQPEKIVAARHGSPLVVGFGEEAMLCGSDIPALLSHTRDMIFLEDGDLAELAPGKCIIQTLAGAPVERAKKRIDWSPVMAEKGGYKHFMLKEIHEQPDAIAQTVLARVDLEAGDVFGEEIGLTPEMATGCGRVYIVACGTSAHAGQIGRYWIEELAQLPCFIELGSEAANRETVFFKDDLLIAVSQSGETFDTIGAVKKAKHKGRGIASGNGKTAGRGMKGQKARKSGGVRPGFEGGQMPMQRRLPKRGFTNLFKKQFAEVSVGMLNRFEDGATIDEAVLREAHLVHGHSPDGVKLIGNDELTKKLTVKVNRITSGAKGVIEGAGGTVELIPDRPKWKRGEKSKG